MICFENGSDLKKLSFYSDSESGKGFKSTETNKGERVGMRLRGMGMVWERGKNYIISIFLGFYFLNEKKQFALN